MMMDLEQIRQKFEAKFWRGLEEWELLALVRATELANLIE